MHLKCDCLVQSSDGTSTNRSQSKTKPHRAIISIGMDKGEGALLVTNSSSKPEFTCRLAENVEKLFDKYLKDGKLTVRFKEPQTDVLISDADPGDLNQFVKTLLCLAKGEMINEYVKNKTFKRKDFEKPVTEMIISDKCDYPFRKALPPSLLKFEATYCQLDRFDSRILSLKHLTSLDLHGNNLYIDLHLMNFSSLPDLRELRLSGNGIEELPVEEFWSNLPENLQMLNLAGNQLLRIPEIFWTRCKRLTDLRMNRNKLEKLSWRITKLRQTLQYLDLSQNLLRWFPHEIRSLKPTLQVCDFSDNPIHMQFSRAVRWPQDRETTLLDLAAIAVEKYGLPTSGLPGHLAAYVDEQVWPCSICKKLSVKSNLGRAIRYTNPNRLAVTTISVVEFVVPTEIFYCLKCAPA